MVESLDGLSRSLADQIPRPPTLRDQQSVGLTERAPTLHDQQSVSTDVSTPDEPNDATLIPEWPTKNVSHHIEFQNHLVICLYQTIFKLTPVTKGRSVTFLQENF